MIKDFFILSVKNLRTRRLRSWLTMIGIFIGIASIVSLIGLGEGLRAAISSQFNMLGTDMITVQAGGVQFGPPGTGVVTPLKTSYSDLIGKIQGVDIAIPRLIKSTKIEFNNREIIGFIGSVPDKENRKFIEERIGLKVSKGRLLKDGDRYKIFLGSSLIDDTNFGKEVNVGDKLLITGKQFEVIGIGQKLGSFFIDSAILMNEDIMREHFNEKEDTSLIVIKVNKNIAINKVKTSVEKELRRERHVKEGEEDFTVELAVDVIKTLEDTLFAVQLFVYIIASISLIVGGIGIMNTMYTAVVERTRDIGIMKSIGAMNKDIFFLFFIESGLLGMIGGLIGVAVGVLFAKTMAFIGSSQLNSDLIQAQFSLLLILGSLSFSFIVGCIAGIIPAIRASRLHPVDALRYTK